VTSTPDGWWVRSTRMGVFTHRSGNMFISSKRFVTGTRYFCLSETNGMKKTDIRLRERVKELKCLYDLSRIAWEADNDLEAIVRRTLEILPSAMQCPAQAEASITIDGIVASTRGFAECIDKISSPLTVGKTKRGQVSVGYTRSKNDQRVLFLPEEKKLLKTVAREFALMIKRAAAEEEKQKLQIQLQHVERLAFVGELSAGIAHELNEPLGRILGFAQLIKKTGGLNDQQNQDIERIVKASLYTREIIKKLMIFSRQMPRQITWVNLNDIVSNILYFIDMRFVSREVNITHKLDPNLPLVQADEVQMSQVLVNLITNGIHAMAKGGDLVVTTRRKDKGVSVSVRDTGHGMTSEIRKKIFEPFFTTKPAGQGTGLGLSVAQGIVIAHKGRIKVNSHPGKGTTMEVLLPAKQSGKEQHL
jgi:two-component system NtrC family sensor kinase